MTGKVDVLRRIETGGLVPVLRAGSEEEALQVAEAVIAGGVDVLELTMTLPGAMHVLGRLKRERPELLLGAGTVLDPETARICILEGAEFIVSPATNLATIALCQRYSIAVLPGALTPTEIVAAWQAGADAVKVFPANSMGGPTYLRSIAGPLPQVRLIPTGGVSVSNARAFLEAGAMALGVGADLVDLEAIRAGHSQRVTQKAEEYVGIVRAFQAGGD